MKHFYLLAACLSCFFQSLDCRANLDPKNFDLSVKPQDDFYRYANGHWLASNPVPPEFASWGGFAELRDLSVINLRKLCEAAAAKGEKGSSIERMVGDLYASGMDEAAINAAGIKPLQPELARIEAIQNTKDLLVEMANLHSMGIGAGFRFGASADRTNSSMEMANISQGGLGLPERGYYFKDDEKSQKIREQYVTHIGKMLVLLGTPPEEAVVGAQAVMALETKLALGALPRVKLRDPYASYHKMTLVDALNKTPGLDLKSYFGTIKGPAFEEINLAHPAYFKGFESTVNSVSISDWKTYLKWHLISSTAAFLSEPFVQESFNFHGRILSGTTEIRPRWKRVVATVDGSLGEALGQLYVAEFFPPESKAQMLKLVEDLRGSMRDRFNAIDWMDDITRVKALEKLDSFKVKIGYPDKWLDYSSIKIDRTSYAENIFRINAFEKNRNIHKIGEPVDRGEWGMTPPTVNAYYNSANNEIVFPAAILQPPFFDPKADDAVNYGGIGAVIGHEMTHGFDDSGRQSDAHGNLVDWWTPSSAEKFKQRASAVVKQFSAFSPLEGLHLNGELTQGENIADLGGVKIAYGALQKALAGKPPMKIDGFTPEQRFFLSYATIWRINFRPEALRLQVLTDPHSPGEFRANGPLSNLDEFFQAFSIPEGSPMRRAVTDRVTIW